MDDLSDVIIIGAGASGLAAAIAAHDAGATVRIVEKNAQLGGTAAISGGVVWTPGNLHMQGVDLEADRRTLCVLEFPRNVADIGADLEFRRRGGERGDHAREHG